MAARKPTTLEQFSTINGVGRVKLKQYGERFVTTIQAYVNGSMTAPTTTTNTANVSNATAPPRIPNGLKKITAVKQNEANFLDKMYHKSHFFDKSNDVNYSNNNNNNNDNFDEWESDFNPQIPYNDETVEDIVEVSQTKKRHWDDYDDIVSTNDSITKVQGNSNQFNEFKYQKK